MKLLMVKQPFANLITLKLKPIETRFWGYDNLKYRGELLIASSKKPMKPLEVKSLLTPQQWAEFEEVRKKLPHDIYSPLGVAQCVVTLIDYRPMNKLEDEKGAFVRFQDGLKVLCLDNVRPVVSFPVKGMLGMPDVPEEYKNLISFD